MKNKRIAKNPLLYIDQPIVNTPMASMQSDYQSTKVKKETPTVQQDEERAIRFRPKRGPNREKNSSESINEETSSKDNLEIEEKANTEEKKDKPEKFKNMSIHEKIEYFADVPMHIPKMKCEIKTEEKSYRGIITEFDGETIFIQRGSRVKPISIPFNEVKHVRMIGF